MIRHAILGLAVAGIIAVAGIGHVHAQTHGDRPIYGFNCVGFPGATVYGTIHGYIKAEKRLIAVNNYTSSLTPSVARYEWPPIYYEDGKILGITLHITSQVISKPGYPVTNILETNTHISMNGFISGSVIANPNAVSRTSPPGLCNYSISIGPDEPQEVVTR
jgi:hypothetical protein